MTTGLRDYPWRLSYSTSAHLAGGKPIDILHDFYILALQRAKRIGFNCTRGLAYSNCSAIMMHHCPKHQIHAGVVQW